MDSRLAVPLGTILDGSYRIGGVVGSGGFGITYKAEDVNLGTVVAIKEYYPFEFGDRDATMSVRPKSDRHKQTFEWGRTSFLQEARMLARFRHPSIVRVTRVFEAHSTAYMVMEFETGQTFEAWLTGLGRPPTQEELDRIAAPLLDALELMHTENFLHRDIAPDNIVVRTDGSPVLLDFGAARRAVAEMSRSLTGIVKAGYSPHEQYATDSRLQGPWSDIYALGATLYRAAVGKPPEEATLRLADDRMRPATEVSIGDYRPGFLAAIDACLRARHTDRPQSIAQLRPMLLGTGEQPKSVATSVIEVRRSPTEGVVRASVTPVRPSSAGRHLGLAAAIVAMLGGALGGFEYLRRHPANDSGLVAQQREATKHVDAEAQRQRELAAQARRDLEARTKAEAEVAARKKVEQEARARNRLRSAADLIERVLPATVTVHVRLAHQNAPLDQGAAKDRFTDLSADLPADHPLREFFKYVPKNAPKAAAPKTPTADEPKKGTQSSGFLISSDGYVVVSDARIADATEIEIVLQDGTRHRVTGVLGRHADTDLALVKIAPPRQLPFVHFAKHNPGGGERVLVIGTPFGLSGTVSIRKVGWWSTRSLLEVEHGLKQGEAGAPLFDPDGAVVGVASAHGWASPGTVAAEVIEQLRSHGEMKPDVFKRAIEKAKDLVYSPSHLLAFQVAKEIRDATRRKIVSVNADQARGLGVFVSADGYVVTTNNLIKDAKQISVHRHDGQLLSAELVGADPRTDLALLRIRDPGTVSFALWAIKQPRVGDPVFSWNAVDSGRDEPRQGIVSGLDRDIGQGPYGYLQSDLRIEKEESGGAAFNHDGEIVAINAAIFSPSGRPEGIAFAIPSTKASAVIDELMRTGTVKRGWLGVKIQNMDEGTSASLGIADRRGALVTEASEDTPAQQAGIRIADVIRAVNGDNVADSRDLARKIAELTPGSKPRLDVFRNGKTLAIEVVLGTFPGTARQSGVPPQRTTLPVTEVTGERVRDLGMELVSVSQYSKSAISVKDGVFVVSVDAGTAAAENKLARGDVILEVAQTPLRWVREVQEQIDAAKQYQRKVVLLRVRSGDTVRLLGLPIGSKNR